MRCPFSVLLTLLVLAALPGFGSPPPTAAGRTANIPVLVGIRDFFEKTANADGSFRPGIDPAYRGMADTAYSDLAAPAYAVVLHKTFGWRLPHEDKTSQFLLGRQGKDGAFFNLAGTVDPKSLAARLYNTTQGVVALHALGVRPKFDPRPVLDGVLAGDYRKLPPYTTSFFPLAYLAAGGPYPKEADRKVRSLLVQAEDGYMLNHIANTFHLAHYYRLLGEQTPKAEAIVRRALRDQAADGSWLINPPARDRHATFDAVFVLRQLGGDRPECRKAIARAAAWALTCRNADGGFGHYPGSPSDADAVYFHVGTLVMAGVLQPADPRPRDPHLLGWGHLFPTP
jgi:geranylgeranyl transferase type-2 subunit beta